MSFEVHDTVVIFGRPIEMGPPHNGMRGFIDAEHGDGYYTFVALSSTDGLVKGEKHGEGGCHKIFFKLDDGNDLIDALNTVLYKREENYNKIMATHHLKNIIENNEDE